jgi:hypothetical protein
MKTMREVAAWIEGGLRQFGDPSEPVGLLFARYTLVMRQAETDVVWTPGPESLFDAAAPLGGMLWLAHGADGWLDLPIAARPALSPSSCLDHPAVTVHAFGAELIADGLWALTPSLNVLGLLHVFVVLYGVPTPAPWEPGNAEFAGG